MAQLHSRNPHQGRYDIALLCNANTELKAYVTKTPTGQDTIDFSNNQAVIALNKALLMQYYGVQYWQLPDGFLCPPIPGRADYIHYAADLLANSAGGKVPVGKKVTVLDVGTGANVVYPIIGSQTYGWQFVASEVNTISLKAAEINVQSNPNLKTKITLVKQPNVDAIFKNVIQKNSKFALSVCNPPFHSSAEDALSGTRRKNRNLSRKKTKPDTLLNFGGQSSELWCEGGELGFISKMITESVLFKQNVAWFSCLVSKNDHLSVIKRLLKKAKVMDIEIIDMAQGQKVSRFVAWTFLTKAQQKQWFGD